MRRCWDVGQLVHCGFLICNSKFFSFLTYLLKGQQCSQTVECWHETRYVGMNSSANALFFTDFCWRSCAWFGFNEEWFVVLFPWDNLYDGFHSNCSWCGVATGVTKSACRWSAAPFLFVTFLFSVVVIVRAVNLDNYFSRTHRNDTFVFYTCILHCIFYFVIHLLAKCLLF